MDVSGVFGGGSVLVIHPEPWHSVFERPTQINEGHVI
jgi:hypothetical protein